MHHLFIVNVRTDDKHIDAPDALNIRNEIRTHLEHDAFAVGIESVSCRVIRGSFDDAVIKSFQELDNVD